LVNSTDPNGGCVAGVANCGVCGQTFGPATYLGLITSNPAYGDLDRQSYVVQLCEVAEEPSQAFVEVKACRQVKDPVKCPSGGGYTSCGCAASPRATCKPCETFASEFGGNNRYVPPFGTIDPGFGAGDPLARHGRDDLAHNQTGNNAGGLVQGNYLQFSYKDACYPSGNYCIEDRQCCNGCQLNNQGWGTCK
jgi:hypothetical protein